jgi:hypothetical protein
MNAKSFIPAAVIVALLLQGFGLHGQQPPVPVPPQSTPLPSPSPSKPVQVEVKNEAEAAAEKELLKIVQTYWRPPTRRIMPIAEAGVNVESALATLAMEVLRLQRANEELRRDVAELKKK